MAILDWQPVDSDVVSHEAYDPDAEVIYLRFHRGTEWAYQDCPPQVWAEFTAPGQSRGQYFNRVLKFKPAAQIG